MTAVEARRVAVILRDLATSLPYGLQSGFKTECHTLAGALEQYAAWKQVAEAPVPVDGGWTA